VRDTQGRDLRRFNEGPVGSAPDIPATGLDWSGDGEEHPVMAGLEAEAAPPEKPAIDE
jgi:hypothetical protein